MENQPSMQEQALQKILHQTVIDKTNLQLALEMANIELKKLNELLAEKEDSE